MCGKFNDETHQTESVQGTSPAKTGAPKAPKEWRPAGASSNTIKPLTADTVPVKLPPQGKNFWYFREISFI